MTTADLASLLRRSRFDVIPLDGAEERVLAHLPEGATVAVTASPTKGLDATLDLVERLTRAGYDAVPHLSARLIRDRYHLAHCSTAPKRGRAAREVIAVANQPRGEVRLDGRSRRQ